MESSSASLARSAQNMVAPISEDLIDINRCAVDAVAPTKAAIDFGCSLSKFLFIAKDADVTGVSYTFHCALFRNEDFENGLRFLKEKALLPAEGKLRVTGVRCDVYKELIAEVLGLEIEFIDGTASKVKGLHFLLTNATSHEALFYPEIEVPPANHRTPILDALVKNTRENLTANDSPDPSSKLPCVFLRFGSAALCHLVNPDGSSRLLGKNMVAGKSLLGLSKALVGTNSYSEIMELAEKGSVSNLDTTIGEFMREDPNSGYGHLSQHLPLFSFGKMIDSDLPLEDYEREDRAVSLARLIAININMLAFTSASVAGVSRVIVGGPGVRGDVMRRLIATSENLTRPADLLNMKFLRTDHTGAFGAMVFSS